MTNDSFKAWIDAMPIDDVRRRIERLERKLSDLHVLERIHAERHGDEGPPEPAEHAEEAPSAEGAPEPAEHAEEAPSAEGPPEPWAPQESTEHEHG